MAPILNTYSRDFEHVAIAYIEEPPAEAIALIEWLERDPSGLAGVVVDQLHAEHLANILGRIDR